MLTQRWHILALLLFARGSMGFQFQSLAPVAPLIQRDLALTPARFGVLVGLYMLPGIFVAIPAALVGRWLGGKRGLLIALGLMAASGFLLAEAGYVGRAGGIGGFGIVVLARLIGGTGMAVLNVLVTKLVADLFAGKESATAMGLLLAMWPAGIALALATLGGLASVQSWQVSAAATGIWPLVALVLVAVLYRNPSQPEGMSGLAVISGTKSARNSPKPSLRLAGVSSTAGWAWSFYNCGFIVLAGFGPTILADRGLPLAQAGLVTSFITWGVMAGTPAGGMIADATKRPRIVVLFACLSASLAIGLVALGNSALHFLLMGFLIGLPTGPIMAMLGEKLPESERGLGYGILLSWYYLGMGAVQPIGGWVVQAVGTSQAIIPLSAALVLLTLAPYEVFQRILARSRRLSPVRR